MSTTLEQPANALAQPASLLRFVTCGSVDDGKSTLIGRLLFDSKGIYEDQLAAVESASSRYGTTGGTIDLALLTDGLKAEREQGITIDVAYRYFSTPRRPFIIADCPGHEQYTRNMATGASTADVAILLIDARPPKDGRGGGVVTQTRRHAFIVHLLGIRHVILAVNKMDLVDWSEARFNEIVADFHKANERIGLTNITPIPMSALTGENVTAKFASPPAESASTPAESASTPAESASTPAESASTPAESASTPAKSASTPANLASTPEAPASTPDLSPSSPPPLIASLPDCLIASPPPSWYSGPTLLEHLESLDLSDPLAHSRPFRFPVQYVSRPHSNFRGYMGEVASGTVRPGDEITVLPGMGGAGKGSSGSGERARVTAVYDADGPTASLSAGQAGTITLATEIDASRGNLICSPATPPQISTRIRCHLICFSPDPITLGTTYRLKHNTRQTTATLTRILHKIDINTLDQLPAPALAMNDIALVELETAHPLVFDPYTENRTTGSFVLIDRITNNTAAAGMILANHSTHTASHSTDLTSHTRPITPLQRALRLGQTPAIISFTGDPTTTLQAAQILESLLFHAGHLAAVISDPDPTHQQTALNALTSAGLIAILPTPHPKATLTLPTTPTTPPQSLARQALQKLQSTPHLTAPSAEFEI